MKMIFIAYIYRCHLPGTLFYHYGKYYIPLVWTINLGCIVSDRCRSAALFFREIVLIKLFSQSNAAHAQEIGQLPLAVSA
jgi:hypothetical protein